jgi:hypothetical protein
MKSEREKVKKAKWFYHCGRFHSIRSLCTSFTGAAERERERERESRVA